VRSVLGVVVVAAVLVTAATLGPAGSVSAQSSGAQQPDERERATSENAVDVAEAAGETEQSSQTDDSASATEAAGDVPYTVECEEGQGGAKVCRVDRATYVGWRTFHAVCHTCHAQDAVGSTFAPALLPRIKQMDKDRFVMVVDQGFTGQVGVMPAWGMNPNVNRYYDELWAYLRARSDGVLPPGRPERLPEE